MRWNILLLLIVSFVNEINAKEMERKKANVTATYEIIINAPINQVWDALAVDYGGIGKWASGVNHVIESSGQGVTARRFCEISAAGFNDTREKIIKWDPDNYYFEYDLYDGLPGMVDYSINKDRLIDKNGKTLWVSTNEMRVGGIIGATIKGVMRNKLKAVLESKAHELKYYIETGRQHSNKLEAIARKEGKELFVLEQNINVSAEKVWEVIAHNFARVSDSHPVSPKSDFANGSDTVQLGSQRIMYMTQNEKKYFVDEIIGLDNKKRELLINVVKAKGYPIKFSNVRFIVDIVGKHESQLIMIFSYQTKPKMLQKMAKKGLKKQLQEYIYAIDHHCQTGEKITKKNWSIIREKYHKK